MDAFYERLMIRAATIDEILSEDFEILPGRKGDTDLAARRLAAWCRSSASGDWSLFNRRLERDRLSLGEVLPRLATVRRSAEALPPQWADDAIWIEAALRSSTKGAAAVVAFIQAEPIAFEHLLAPVVEQAEARLCGDLDRDLDNLNESARATLRRSLLGELSSLCAPALYERFGKARKSGAASADADRPQSATSQYDRFVADMKAGGFHGLFEDKPVLLRLVASITRQWIDTSRELIMRLDADLASIRREILQSCTHNRVAKIEGSLSDLHNGGRSVQIVSFEDGARVVYKPKDLGLDVAWRALIGRLNQADPPVELRAARVLARDGYGWAEFVDHTGCTDLVALRRFFERAGAWLALFHWFASSDMHQENMIAAGEHPVPIDLETILQANAVMHTTKDVEAQAFEAAMEAVDNSVMSVGLLPAYGRLPENKIFAMGGMTSNWTSRTQLEWSNINCDNMRPAKLKKSSKIIPNLPHVDGQYAKFGDHIDDFVAGFEQYARFLLSRTRDAKQGGLFDGFAGLAVRKVVRPTRFYYMLLQRLKHHRTMDDGVVWSAQADFLARLADWEQDWDPAWPLQRAERKALLALNVPHFVSPSDRNEIHDASGILARNEGAAGFDVARMRVRSFEEHDIAWQVEVIRQNTATVSRSAGPVPSAELPKLPGSGAGTLLTNDILVEEANNAAAELLHSAIRRGPGAAWIGLDWLGDSETSQLVPLGVDLYNGVSGIALFLAAHASVTGRAPSQDLALAAVAHLRKRLKSRNAPRMARSLGIGGAIGLGSIVYALTVMSTCFRDRGLLDDALVAAELFTDDLIAADRQLDVIGGSAGGILGLLRLYRDTQSGHVLERATKCGEHLLAQSRSGPEGCRSWSGQGSGPRPLNGMSHGAAGFAYALASLAAATGHDEFATAAEESITFENSSFDAERKNWPDVRGDAEPLWPCQWCHGATGIGLARIATNRQGRLGSDRLVADVLRALDGLDLNRHRDVDTLCCGTLGNIEFMCEAGRTLGRSDLGDRASRQLASVLERAASTRDYRWNAGGRRFNLGFFRGLAGAGYTCLRRVDGSLPNVLIWE
jgi:type 2 lantibiotic biosynthesis protein LanM